MENELFSKFSYRVIPSISDRYNEVEVTFNYGEKAIRKYYFAPKDKDPIEYVDQRVDAEIKNGSLKRYADDFGKFKNLKRKSIVAPVTISLLSAVALTLGGLLAWKWLTPTPVTPPPVVDKFWSVVFRPSSENHKGHWEDNDKAETRIVKVKDNTLIKETDIPVAKPDATKGGEFAYWSEEGKNEEINLSVTKITTDLVLEARYGSSEIDPETFEDHDDSSENYFTMIYPRQTADIVGYEESIYNDHIKDSEQLNPIPVNVDDGEDIVQTAKTMILDNHENVDLIFVDSEDMLMKFLDSGIPFRRFDDADGIKDLIKNDQIYIYQFDACSKTKGDDKHLYAMPIFASPTLFLYRRSIAKQYFGTDDPTDVATNYIANMDQFEDTSELLKAKGCSMVFPTRDDAFNLFKATRTAPWLINDNATGKLIFKKEMKEFITKYLDFAKKRYDQGFDGELQSWWWDGWQNMLEQKDATYFGFNAPAWIPNTIAGGGGVGIPSHGDWAVAIGPSCGTDGGQYILVPQGSKNPKTALDFVTKLLTTDSNKYLTSTPQGTSIPFHTTLNKQTLSTMALSYTGSPFLGGQNHFEIFKHVLDNNLEKYYPCVYEKEIDGYIRDAANSYIEGATGIEEAINLLIINVGKLDERIIIEQ